MLASSHSSRADQHDANVVDVYRRAMFRPFTFAGGMIALAAVAAIGFEHVLKPAAAIGAGLVAPYALYLAFAIRRQPLVSEDDHSRVMRFAPIGAGAILGAGVVALGVSTDSIALNWAGLRQAIGSFALSSNVYLAIGYLYVWQVEVEVADFKRQR